MLEAIFPFLTWFRIVTKDTIKADMVAGLTGAVIVLPQGVAFATIAGLPPQYGLYTAMVTPIVAALFGSSRHLVSGPTTAISIVVFSAVSNHAEVGSPEFISLALTLTFMAGVYQLAFGLARMGALVNFVSHTVVTGFTAGAAILIVTSQMKHITGIGIVKGESFVHVWLHLLDKLDQVNFYLVLIALVTILATLISRRLRPGWPGLLIGMIAGSVSALLLGYFSTDIQLVGKIPAQLPALTSPQFSLQTIRSLAPEAFAIALLGLIEAVSISRSVASRSGQQIDASHEFIGQGLSNIVGSFFSSYAGSGSFTRSGLNYDAGAKTPFSAIFAAIFLMIIVLLIAPLTAYLPMSSMGGVIFLVACKLIDYRQIWQVLRFSKSESAILLTTFFATLFLELEFAIYLGVLLSLVLFLAKTSTPRIPSLSIDFDNSRKLTNTMRKPLQQCPQLKIIRIDMSVYFGSITHIQRRISRIASQQKIYKFLIVGSGINFIDLAGAEMLVTENNWLRELGGGLYFSNLKSTVYEFAARTCFIRQIGNSRFFDSKTDAIREIYKQMDRSICANCKVRLFTECQSADSDSIAVDKQVD